MNKPAVSNMWKYISMRIKNWNWIWMTWEIWVNFHILEICDDTLLKLPNSESRIFREIRLLWGSSLGVPFTITLFTSFWSLIVNFWSTTLTQWLLAFNIDALHVTWTGLLWLLKFLLRYFSFLGERVIMFFVALPLSCNIPLQISWVESHDVSCPYCCSHYFLYFCSWVFISKTNS